MNKNPAEIKIYKNIEELSREAAAKFSKLANKAIDEQGRFTVVLSGGKTPQLFYKLLTFEPTVNQVDWKKVYFFWSDERFVPQIDVDNNYHLAKVTFLDYISVPRKNIYPVPTTGLTIEQAAAQYQKTLLNFFTSSLIQFDVIFLGIGADGHTASIFPGSSEATNPGDQLITIVKNSPYPPRIRLTFTFKLINNAKNVIFLITGKDKARVLQKIMESPLDPINLPAQRVILQQGELTWLVDEAAAKFLSSK